MTTYPMHPEVPPTTNTPVRAVPGWIVFLSGIIAGAFVVGLIWTATAIAGASGSAGAFTLTGSMTLLDGSVSDNESCWGTGGYSDLAEGASTTVYGASGDVVATGSLTGSRPASGNLCVFAFEVADVPGGERFYQVEVSHRGKVSVNAEDARDGNVELSLGN